MHFGNPASSQAFRTRCKSARVGERRYTGLNLSVTKLAKRWTVSLTVDSEKRTYSSTPSVASPYASTLNAA